MVDVNIRTDFRETDRTLVNKRQEFGVESFAGVIPAVGNKVVDRGVLKRLNRREPKSRRMWNIVGRVFNPRDIHDCVELIVEEQVPSSQKYSLVAA